MHGKYAMHHLYKYMYMHAICQIYANVASGRPVGRQGLLR